MDAAEHRSVRVQIMTCKTHTILAALRKLREDGYTGTITPALITKMTGIDKPSKVLGHIKKSGYLIATITLKLETSRGTTEANGYVINPESDLMPKGNGRVAKKPRSYSAKWFENQEQVEQRNAEIGGRLFAVLCQKWPHTVNPRACM